MPRAMVGLLIGLVFALFTVGCRTSNSGQRAASPTKSAISTITITDATGASVLVIARNGDGFDVSSGTGKVGRVKLKDGKVNLYDAQGAKAGKVKKSDGDFKVSNAADQPVAKLSAKEGGFRLKDAAGTIYLKIKPRGNDFKVGDGSGATLGKVKAKGGKLKIEDAQGKLRYQVSGGARADTVGILLTQKLTPLQQAGLLVASNQL